MILMKNNDGANEVIGIILMIAVIIIIVGVTTSFLNGMIQNLKVPGIVGLSVTRINSTSIAITNYGGDISMINSTIVCPFTVNINGVNTTASSGNLTLSTGSRSTYPANTGAHIMITALYRDGTTHIVYDGLK